MDSFLWSQSDEFALQRIGKTLYLPGDSRVQSAAHFLQATDGIIDLRRRFREVVAPLVLSLIHISTSPMAKSAQPR